MRILERYICASIIKIFLSTTFIFCFLYILIDAASNLNEIIDRKVPWDVLLLYYAQNLPIILMRTTTYACLVGVLLTFSQMNNHNEIIVMRASGLNFWRIAKPAIVLGLVASAFVFWINERFVPQATLQSEKTYQDNFTLPGDREKKKLEPITNLTFYGLKNRLFYIESFDRNTYDLKGITIFSHDRDQNIQEQIVALEGQWTGIAWKFYKCQISTYAQGSLREPLDVKYYEEKLMDIREGPEDFMRQRLRVTSMNIRQLSDYITRFSDSGAAKALNNLRVDLHEKIAFPVGNMVIILMGIPFVLMTGRRKALTFTSMVFVIGIALVFQVLNGVGLALGKSGVLAPVVAAWLAPGVLFLSTLYFIKIKF